jgi:hypothetical protein
VLCCVLCSVQFSVLQVKGFWLKGVYRTLESISRNAQAYAAEGRGDRGRLMQYFNCEHEVCINLINLIK